MRAGMFAVLAASLALCACAGAMIKEKMKPYVGQPASALIAKLGYPTREEQVAGQKVFVWSSGQVVEGTSYT
jgi:hypothetical protein